jgi:hypothetical protein
LNTSENTFSMIRLLAAAVLAFLLAYSGVPSIVILIFFGLWFVIEYLVFEWGRPRNNEDDSS